MIIKDGAGTGNTASVDSQNRLKTEAVTITHEHNINEEFQKAFTLPFDGIDPVGADDYFF